MSKINSKEIFLYLFQGVGLLASLFATIFGLLYITEGNLTTSLIAGFFSIILLVLLVNQLVYYKTKKKSFMDFALFSKGLSKDKGKEYLMLTFYGIVFLILSVIQFHYLQIDLFQKEDLKDKAYKKISNINSLFNSYDNRVNQINDSRSSDIPDEQLIKSRKNTADEYANKIKDLKDSWGTHLENYSRLSIDQWSSVNISKTLVDLDKFYNDLFNRIKPGIFPEFEHTSTGSDPFLLDNPKATITSAPAMHFLISIFIILIINFCILIAYFTSHREELPFELNPRVEKKSRGARKYDE